MCLDSFLENYEKSTRDEKLDRAVIQCKIGRI